ncbi:hypothetical protein Tco_1246583 [Tanacetum coccineum]
MVVEVEEIPEQEEEVNKNFEDLPLNAQLSEYFQIPVEPADQEKSTFTCPYGTYAYNHMPFSLCNASATFQRRMIAIFKDMLETSMEVSMEGTVLGHKVSSAGFEVDKAKIKVIAKLPPPTKILLLQEFDIEIKNKKGVENVTTYHLSRLENLNLEELRDDDIDENSQMKPS